MPTITATAQSTYGRVLIQVDWSDYPAATYAKVTRTEPDGTQTVVRSTTMTDPSGDYMLLSGGQAIFYDTEAPMDVALTYTTEALGITFAPIFTNVVTDLFTRTVAAGGWGTATSGQLWDPELNDPDFSVNGTTGLVAHPVVNIEHRIVVPTSANAQRVRSDFLVNVTPTGATISTGVLLGFVDVNNFYWVDVQVQTTGLISIRMVKRLSGTSTSMLNVNTTQVHSTSVPRIVLAELINPGTASQTLRATTYLTTDPPLTGWLASIVDATVSGGTSVGTNSRRTTGNTNVNPTIAFDNFYAYDIDNPATASTTVTVLSSGGFWLKAPLRPWADQAVTTSQLVSDPACTSGDSIFFSAMAEESRPNRTQPFMINNRKNPIPATRVRGGIVSALRLVSRTFVARDRIIELNAPGDSLLFQAPSAYGIPDRYMMIADYSVSRFSADHKKEWRANVLPHVEVDRPAGLAAGVLGVRWIDICDTFVTFDDATAGGLTTTQILLGYAASPPITTGFRIYSDIPIDFATYDDIPLGGRTYDDLLEGD